MKLVSVVMPVYNSEIYLNEAIESILNQTYKNFEFIIINDGSTDNSLEKIEHYMKKDSRIKLINRENKGLVYSLNEGINFAKGKYIARMDADDISLPERLEKQLDYMYENRDVSILGTLVDIIGSADIYKRMYSEKYLNWQLSHDNIEKMFLRGYSLCHPTFFMKKSDIVKKIKGYSNQYLYAEDYDFLMRTLKTNLKINILPEKLLKYRLHENNKSIKDNSDYRTVRDIFNIKLDYLEDLILNKKEYVIWGAGNGGKIAYDILNNRFTNIDIKAFIDKFEVGNKINEINVYDLSKINKFKDKYFFIATTPGKEEAQNTLKSLGLKEIENYISLV
ncbi:MULTISPECIES: glycosyltransferase [unclassified Clostridium]|uniref:glycosyltransferase n=1 Tax=unclassified Clostridium TaxID=2614128 RepID=UPI001DCF6966|nr:MULTISPECIES: glycosyltransferase [unclassified Clostridium]MBN1044497.1 glycosyltransferase [Clostridium botulinum]